MVITYRPGRQADQLIMKLAGDLDLYASVAFCNNALAKLEAGTRRLLLDFGEVRYLDSSGVGALIRLLQKAKTLGGEIRLANLGGTPRKVLTMSNILALLKVSPDVDSALAAWG